MSKIPLYKTIYHYYKDKILSGEYHPGDQLPTQKEIKEEFGVSRITVIKAMKELESSDLIYRVQGSGSYVNEREDKIEKHKGGKLSMISLVLPFRMNISSALLRGVEKIADKYNYFVTFHNTTNNPKREKKILNEIISAGSQGIILYPLETNENIGLYSNLIIDKYPLVLVDRSIPGIQLPLVSTNNRKAFSNITKHLLELGHTRIIFVGTDVFKISSQTERYEGFCDAHVEYGIRLLDKHLYSIKDIDEIPSSYKSNELLDRRAFNYLFDILEGLEPAGRPTAIAAINDQMAASIISVAQERGIRIPEQYSVTGFDNLPFSAMLSVPLTTYAQPFRMIGRNAAKELIKRIKSPEIEPSIRTIEGKLIIRKSTNGLKNQNNNKLKRLKQ